MPIDTRFTPMFANASARARSSDVGFASIVTSRSAAQSNPRFTPATTRPSSSGAQRLGVPPPKKTLAISTSSAIPVARASSSRSAASA